jgi:DHA1 family multidrug resistance protein-like MFS transporter
LLGGLAAAGFGYRGAFLIASGMAFVNAIVVIFLVREPARSAMDTRTMLGFGERLTLGFRVPGWRAAILATLGYQAAYSVGYVLLPLQIISFTGQDNAAAAVGWVIAANAAGVACGAAVLGWLTARVGSRRMTVLALLAAGVLTIPLSSATTTVAFAGLRFALGFCIGGVLPSLRTIIAEAARTPEEEANLGAVYGLSTSAVSAGGVIGAPLASGIASLLGFPAVQLVSAALLVSTAVWYSTRAGHATPARAY